MKKQPTSRRSKEDWVRAALEALRDDGVEGVRVEPLAARMGVTKGSFYWHFETREQLLTAALDAWVARGTEAIIEHIEGVQAGPAEKLRQLWRRTAHDSARELSIELAIRDLAQRDEAVHERVRAVDERRMSYMVGLFRELGLAQEIAVSRSLTLYSLLIGNYFIAARHGRLSRARVLELAVEELIESEE
jgi:AcrR family transcriptional regulator